MSRIDNEPDVPIGAGATAHLSGYMTYIPPLSEQIWRWLGFHEPAPVLLEKQALDQGWNEELFTSTTLKVSFADRLRLLITGTAKLAIVTSAKTSIPEAFVTVAFAVTRNGSDG